MSSLQARPTRILTRVLALMALTLTRTRRELLTPTLTLTRRELPAHVPIGEVGLRRRALLRRAGKPRQAAGGDGTTAEAGLLRTSAEWGQGRGGAGGKWCASTNLCEDDDICYIWHLDPLSLSDNLPRYTYGLPRYTYLASTRPRYTKSLSSGHQN